MANGAARTDLVSKDLAELLAQNNLHKQFDAHVRGVDLTTLHSNSTFKQKTGGDLARDVLSDGSKRVRRDRIHKLWDDPKLNDALYIRAWLSAW